MMNLEVLFQSADLTGNDTLRDIATSHANTTMKNHIRTDGTPPPLPLYPFNFTHRPGSTWHLVEYNSTTGLVIKKGTAQGYSDNSTWSRGQAWGIYGFANSVYPKKISFFWGLNNSNNVVFNRTGNIEYLVTARRLATYFLNNLPDDGIVPWSDVLFPSISDRH